MLRRIYGTAWSDKKALKAYLHRLEEAEKRDHRKIGRDQKLFMFHQWAPGATFWLAKGATLWNTLADYMRVHRPSLGVVLVRREVTTPLLQDALRAGVREVLDDGTTRALYSSDASLYRVPPAVVVRGPAGAGASAPVGGGGPGASPPGPLC